MANMCSPWLRTLPSCDVEGSAGLISALHSPVHLVEPIGDVHLEFGEEVTVGVERHLDAAVPESLHDRSGMGALSDEHRGVAVTQIVETDPGVDSCSDGSRLEVTGMEVGLSHRGASRRGEHELVRPLPTDVGRQVVSESGRKWDRAAAPCLRRSDLEMPVCLARR